MIFAGIKLVTGYELRPNCIGHTEDSVNMVKHYLRLGEKLFQFCCNRAVKSDNFRRVDWQEMANSFSSNLLGNSMRLMGDFQKSFQESFNFSVTGKNDNGNDEFRGIADLTPLTTTVLNNSTGKKIHEL
ncbi:hypothetical protein C6P42_004516 [Pichia californica]|nr:hypothetical protein C6P42_004516 [[Candida] californica]